MRIRLRRVGIHICRMGSWVGNLNCRMGIRAGILIFRVGFHLCRLGSCVGRLICRVGMLFCRMQSSVCRAI